MSLKTQFWLYFFIPHATYNDVLLQRTIFYLQNVQLQLPFDKSPGICENSLDMNPVWFLKFHFTNCGTGKTIKSGVFQVEKSLI